MVWAVSVEQHAISERGSGWSHYNRPGIIGTAAKGLTELQRVVGRGFWPGFLDCQTLVRRREPSAQPDVS